MPWSQQYFKGKAVWVLVDEAGDHVTTKGLVPMRYSPDEDAKQYSAHPRNLSATPEDGGSGKEAGGAAPKKSQKKAGAGTKSKAGAISATSDHLNPLGPRVISGEVPDELLNESPPGAGVIEIYTDGACSGNPGPCGYGAVVRDGDSYEEVSQYLGQGTNNIGELMAIKVALERIEERDRPVRLYTDSTYCIGVLTKGWKAKVNQQLILETKVLVKEFSDLKFFKVKGHSGHPLNERADHLATSSLSFANKVGKG